MEYNPKTILKKPTKGSIPQEHSKQLSAIFILNHINNFYSSRNNDFLKRIQNNCSNYLIILLNFCLLHDFVAI